MNYKYQAKLVRIVDGDTLDACIDLGFHISQVVRLRLLGVNAAEMHAKDPAERAKALGAKLWLEGQIKDFFTVQTFKADSFGRYLADVWVNDTHINQLMLDENIAVKY